ncbi:D-alanyl-D-alanine carboxypeptidase family protein [Alteribacillus iranensis]|uniref:serine-type D-Ala-D-Ala carboxypeptidase n=1 Tax=Alteribacillus iranensis TaxID=930128 RepID=A0A1I1ZKB7_9BACI|nr:D-alanyl-D-alanine carboxypeptidase family protein [Alteribacillus iranensis]SFE32274.1 D-Ala-D-Ala carboxypeptidase DacF. Serine peptidase. MEROPS family S11 [Alteribacillus iranensis]
MEKIGLNVKIIITILAVVISLTIGAKITTATDEEVPAEGSVSAYIMEADTGDVLYKKNENEVLPPASMTKIMTMLLVMEAIEEDAISLQEEVTASEKAASMGGSQIFLEEGEQMTVDELLKGVAIASGNDASVALAEHIAGSEEKFVKQMNEKAKELGLEHTKFQNTTGLPAEDHYTTAKDLAVMSQSLLKHEKILEYTSVYEDYLRKGTDKEFWLVNTNRLVKHYDGVDGIKTGFTKEAKYNLTATAKKNDMRVITVLMGAETPKERNKQTAELLDYSFQNFEYHLLGEKGTEIDEIAVEKGKQKKAGVMLEENAAVVLPKGKNMEEVKEKIILSEKIQAPAEQHTPAGKIEYYDGEKKIAEQSLVLTEDIDSASWFGLFKRVMAAMTGGMSEK